MAYTEPASDAARLPGTRRQKFANYLKAANELRQNYFQSNEYHPWGKEGHKDGHEGAFPDAAVVRNGNEEMILFPSYARTHFASRAKTTPVDESNDAEFWQNQWTRHEDERGLVDVDVRGWVYNPQRGAATRKQRLMIGLARQLSGVPAPASQSAQNSQEPSRASSPNRISKQDEDLIQLEAENIMQQHKIESDFAGRGVYSEAPGQVGKDVANFGPQSRSVSSDMLRDQRKGSVGEIDDDRIRPIQKRESWPLPAQMNQAELVTANKHLLDRLRPFMATPLVESPVKAFFYNDKTSRERTSYTDASGHFQCRTKLDFIPTHVRVLAGDKLSATEEVFVTTPKGVSMISDIDDTVKHSAISSGAREIFRNAFIRDLGDLTIDGVREWYQKMVSMGVKMHYVSNSPWQMYPVLTSFFKTAGLPIGSFHLKQYTGMLQGIFEPVAERKRSSLDKIIRDFPDRKFILVGDSGEADLEVYTEVVLDHPGRILGVFIRDVTTTVANSGYFDFSNGTGFGSGYGSGSGTGSRPRQHSRQQSRGNLVDAFTFTKRQSRAEENQDEDPELQAAIAASIASAETEARINRHANADERPPLPPRVPTSPLAKAQMSASPEEDLIDFGDDTKLPTPWMSTDPWSSKVAARRAVGSKDVLRSSPSPPPPPKPDSLRSSSVSKQTPPVPRKPSSVVKPAEAESTDGQIDRRPSPLSQVQRQDSAKVPPPLPARRTYRDIAKEKMASVLPSSPTWQESFPSRQRPTTPRARTSARIEAPRPLTAISPILGGQKHPDLSSLPDAPALPQRRQGSSSSLASLRKNANRLSGSDDGLPSSPSEAGLSKKEFMWLHRMAKAKKIMERQGVTLRTWRTGKDVEEVCVKIVETTLREMEVDYKKT